MEIAIMTIHFEMYIYKIFQHNLILLINSMYKILVSQIFIKKKFKYPIIFIFLIMLILYGILNQVILLAHAKYVLLFLDVLFLRAIQLILVQTLFHHLILILTQIKLLYLKLIHQIYKIKYLLSYNVRHISLDQLFIVTFFNFQLFLKTLLKYL